MAHDWGPSLCPGAATGVRHVAFEKALAKTKMTGNGLRSLFGKRGSPISPQELADHLRSKMFATFLEKIFKWFHVSKCILMVFDDLNCFNWCEEGPESIFPNSSKKARSVVLGAFVSCSR